MKDMIKDEELYDVGMSLMPVRAQIANARKLIKLKGDYNVDI